MSMISVKTYEAPKVNRREALRYAGVKESSPEMEALLDECLKLADGKLSYRVCWAEYPVAMDGEELDLGFVKLQSHSLMRNLQGCSRIVLFAATIGMEMDRLIARYARVSPAKSHMLQAVGVERIESLCDLFNDEITQAAGGCTRPRFSPGYGDVNITVQRDVFRALDLSKTLGIILNDNCFMVPSKSVTAIIGVGERRDA